MKTGVNCFFRTASEFVSQSRTAANAAITEWPPRDDYPIVIDENGVVVSRFGDAYWNVTPWTRTPRRLSFDGVSSRRRAVPLDSDNARILKYVVLTWLFGPGRAHKASTVVSKYELMRPLFVLCSQEGISADQLWRFPKVARRLKDCLSPSRAREVIAILHEIYILRRETSFIILLPEQINELSAELPLHQRSQTPYIPPRIWMYIMRRCRDCLQDFCANADNVSALFHFTVDAYRANLEDGKDLYADAFLPGRNPFSSPFGRRGRRTGVVIHGQYHHVAERYGVRALIARWIKGTEIDGVSLKVSDLSKYLSLISFCAEAYLSCFALARLNEGRGLRAGCVEVRLDSSGEPVILIKGQTTKTVDEYTYWVASEFCKDAVAAIERVSLLRISCAIEDPRSPATQDDIDNRPLRLRSYEPWVGNSGDVGLPIDMIPGAQGFMKYADEFDMLFDDGQLTITSEDLDIALSITPGLDPAKFAVGMRWNVAWHQLRRTGAVNMNSSSLVSDKSLQLQLKHSAEAMTRYYSQGYYHLDLVLDEASRREFLSALYEGVARDMAELQGSHFVSPYGEPHKGSLLNLISEKDHRQLVALSRSRAIPYRMTLLGACTNPEPCSFGGVDSLVECSGRGEFCPFVLVDERRLPALSVLKDELLSASLVVDAESPLYSSLVAQIKAIEQVERAGSGKRRI